MRVVIVWAALQLTYQVNIFNHQISWWSMLGSFDEWYCLNQPDTYQPYWASQATCKQVNQLVNLRRMVDMTQMVPFTMVDNGIMLTVNMLRLPRSYEGKLDERQPTLSLENISLEFFNPWRIILRMIASAGISFAIYITLIMIFLRYAHALAVRQGFV